MTTPLELARDESLNRFRSWLRARSLPATPQRVAIATVVLGADHPLSAEEVVDALRAKGPAPGTATVYRTIDVLIQCGLVVEEDRHEGFRRFQPVRDDVSTEELLCTACGHVATLTVDGLASDAAAAARKAGFVSVRHRLVVYGMCAACRALRESQTNEAL
ncbi:MAG: Fur family transcriptional regulator [Gemmatimonadetes bacterium]|nr:Fur family transcriptional regulator [Gemmatimonadota bacterium]